MKSQEVHFLSACTLLKLSKEVPKSTKQPIPTKHRFQESVLVFTSILVLLFASQVEAQYENQIDERFAGPPMMAASGGNYGGGSYGGDGGGGGYGGGGDYENGGGDRPKVHLGIRLRIPAFKFELPRFSLPKITVNAKIRQPNRPRVIQLPEINLDTSSKVSKSPMMMIGGGDYGHQQGGGGGGYQQQSSYGGGGGGSENYGGYSSSSQNHYQHQSYDGRSTENEFSFSTSGDDSDSGLGYQNNHVNSGNQYPNKGGGGYGANNIQPQQQQQYYGSRPQQQYNMQQYQQQQYDRPDSYEPPHHNQQQHQHQSYAMSASQVSPTRVPVSRIANEPVRIETGIFDPRYLLKK